MNFFHVKHQNFTIIMKLSSFILRSQYHNITFILDMPNIKISKKIVMIYGVSDCAKFSA